MNQFKGSRTEPPQSAPPPAHRLAPAQSVSPARRGRSETLTEEIDEFGPEDRVGIDSLMDHVPGQRQFSNLGKYRDYITGKGGLTDTEFDAHVAFLHELHGLVAEGHQAAAVAGAGRLGAVLASHDDTTADQVTASKASGARIAEFPTTEAAAGACRAQGIAVMMGAPNLIRGGSHSGNVATATPAEENLLDILSLDYVPASLLTGAIELGRLFGSVAAGFATVTAAPARVAGLSDRGRLVEGLRADLLRVGDAGGVPVLRGVWVRGRQVA